jgi:hypothetical protein
MAGGPWWEYAMVLDEHGNYIKAPKKNRMGEPSATEIDERIDDYKENAGKLIVLSPDTLDAMQTSAIKENYQSKLRRL